MIIGQSCSLCYLDQGLRAVGYEPNLSRCLGSLKFDQKDATAKAGKVTVDFANPSSTPHGVEIDGNGVEEKTETVTSGDAPPITVDLKPGTYEFYCPVPGHREAGMEGKLTVQ